MAIGEARVFADALTGRPRARRWAGARSSSSTPRLNMSSASGPQAASARRYTLSASLDLPLLVQQTAEVDPRGQVRGVHRPRRARTLRARRRDRRLRARGPCSNQSGGRGSCASRLVAFDHVEFAVLDDDVEREHVLAVVDLPARRTVAHDHSLADRADAQARQRRRLGQVLAQLVERATHPAARDLGLRRAPARCAARSGPGRRSGTDAADRAQA